ncbi:unannotated protein [freshwater metagenome]|uniref:Unannotated protein n=1 Tax=freshwater metagenome TaxID=449393 RepID=A0A6J6ES65_9ZZZZ
MDNKHLTVVERHEEVLPLALRTSDLGANETVNELFGGLSLDRLLPGDFDALHLASDDLFFEFAADGFYFGQFRHRAAHSHGWERSPLTGGRARRALRPVRRLSLSDLRLHR